MMCGALPVDVGHVGHDLTKPITIKELDRPDAGGVFCNIHTLLGLSIRSIEFFSNPLDKSLDSDKCRRDGEHRNRWQGEGCNDSWFGPRHRMVWKRTGNVTVWPCAGGEFWPRGGNTQIRLFSWIDPHAVLTHIREMMFLRHVPTGSSWPSSTSGRQGMAENRLSASGSQVDHLVQRRTATGPVSRFGQVQTGFKQRSKGFPISG